MRPPVSTINQQLMQTRNFKKLEKQLETLNNRTKIVKERSKKMSFVSLDLQWSRELYSYRGKKTMLFQW